jgi:hypothetical protein
VQAKHFSPPHPVREGQDDSGLEPVSGRSVQELDEAHERCSWLAAEES